MIGDKSSIDAFGFAISIDAVLDTQDLARWAIRISVACYVVTVTARIHGRHRIPSRSVVVAWTTGCGFYLVHVLLAFHGFHGWSHSDAEQFTAEETYRMTGIRRGDGIWVNYLFTAVWIVDCARLAVHRRRQAPTSPKLDVATAMFFGLMMFSATVIFGPPIYRVLFVPLAFFWGVLWMFRRREPREISSDEENRRHEVAGGEHQ
ncbi:MAG: hypothetical protein KDB00_08180 [Planctomycetales bacterium]|nr:hypothetical protein [Planctomycetales bacterium]